MGKNTNFDIFLKHIAAPCNYRRAKGNHTLISEAPRLAWTKTREPCLIAN